MGNVYGACGSKANHHALSVQRATINTTASIDSRQLPDPMQPTLRYAKSYHACRSDFVQNKSSQFYNDYELRDVIGVGTYGEVKRCIHRKTGMERAVKVVGKDKIDPKEYGQLMEEVKILLALDHPSILRIYDVYEDISRFYIVTEFLKGGELFDRIIESKQCNEQMAARIMQQVLSAVCYCHKYGVVHRDLKPENVLFTAKGEDTLKIIDFGLAHTFRPNQRLNGLIGTAYYIAPEVIDSDYDEKCDVWSCGVILYVMLSGRPPFEHTEDDELILRQVKKGKYDFDNPVWRNVSSEAKEFIKRMMKVDPKKRCSAYEALQDPWLVKFLQPAPVDQPVAQEALTRLSNFRSGKKLQEATWIYLVTCFSSQEDLTKLRNTFKLLDTDNDGQLGKKELVEGYVKIMGMSRETAEEEADRILSSLDSDHDGKVNYTEFINAAASRRNMLTKERLESAFLAFDKNGDGEITADELKSLFNHEKIKQLPVDVWKRWIEEVDRNMDGKVSFEDFKNMMLAPLSEVPGSVVLW